MRSVPVHLVHGDDEYLVAARAREIVGILAPAAVASLGLEIIDGRASTVEEGRRTLGRCVEALQTMGFFGKGKVVWLRDAELLADNVMGNSEQVRELVRDLTGLLRKSLTAGTILVVSGPKLDKRQAFYKLCSEIGEVYEFTPPEKGFQAQRDAINRLRDLLKKAGLEMAEDVAAAFLERIGTETRAMAVESDKLKVYLGDRRRVEVADILAVTATGREAQAWDLADAVGKKDLGRALALVRQLMFQSKKDRDAGIGMFMSLETRMRELMVYREALEKGWLVEQAGYSRDDKGGNVAWKKLSADVEALVARSLSKNPPQTHPYRAKLLAQQARQFSLPELKRNHRRILDAYEQAVSGTGAGAIGIEVLLVAMLGKKRS
ncbi:MAG: hypothetical protein QME60_02565 [Verrucomicrobiota bacterium]|nr:hypothetical protein [Verrucomicrobiota bacterium]